MHDMEKLRGELLDSEISYARSCQHETMMGFKFWDRLAKVKPGDRAISKFDWERRQLEILSFTFF
jgi:hypothetical protein